MHHGERLNTITHLMGAVFALVATSILITIAGVKEDVGKIVGFSVYGSMMIFLYVTSTVYHWVRHPGWKSFLQRLDYISIYLMIAGSYTPFTLVVLENVWRWTIFGIIWGLALIGISQEILIGKRTRIISLVIYVLMGWLIVVATEPMLKSLATGGIIWLILGGCFYTLGVVVFVFDEKIKHGHGIWHLFVLAGTISHFACLIGYVI